MLSLHCTVFCTYPKPTMTQWNVPTIRRTVPTTSHSLKFSQVSSCWDPQPGPPPIRALFWSHPVLPENFTVGATNLIPAVDVRRLLTWEQNLGWRS